MLIAGRAIAGLGAAGLMNGGLQILTNSTPLEKRPREYFFSVAVVVIDTN